MKSIVANVKRYLSQAETGAGLLFVALAFALLAQWLDLLFVSRASVTSLFAADNPRQLLHFWMLASLAVSAWLAFVLLRRQPRHTALRRILLVAVVHAVGAIRFYDWGLMLLSILPLFALLPAFLLPPRER